MNRYLTNNAFALLTGGSVLIWLSAWITGLCIDPGSWPVRYTLFGIGFLVSGHIVLIWAWRILGEYRAAMRYLSALTSRSPNSVNDAEEEENLPPLESTNPWHSTVSQLADRLSSYRTRTCEAEHVKTSLEVRLQRAQEQCSQVKAILDSLAEPVIAVNHLDEVVLANPSAERLFGFDLDKTELREIRSLVPSADVREVLADTRSRGTVTQRRADVRLGAEGEDQWYRVTARGIPGSERGESSEPVVQGAVAVLRNVGEHRAVQQRNAEFVSAVSHEMKTPLSGIKAYVELLADGSAEDEETQDEFLDVIMNQAERLQRLIDNLLNLARIEAGVVTVSKEPRSLNEVLNEALGVVAPAAETKKIELVNELSPMYLGVLADRDMLSQAAINLLSNAVKYTPEGGRVVLRSRSRGAEVVFEVEDNGVGMAAEDCERVFDKFYRVKSNSDMAQGTGLGLPLAQHIVEDVHGGTISVESQPCVGTTFTVALPPAGKLD